MAISLVLVVKPKLYRSISSALGLVLGPAIDMDEYGKMPMSVTANGQPTSHISIDCFVIQFQQQQLQHQHATCDWLICESFWNLFHKFSAVRLWQTPFHRFCARHEHDFVCFCRSNNNAHTHTHQPPPPPFSATSLATYRDIVESPHRHYCLLLPYSILNKLKTHCACVFVYIAMHVAVAIRSLLYIYYIYMVAHLGAPCPDICATAQSQ